STSLAVVVLPQPLSPTTPSVLPCSIVKEMPSTARTAPPPPPKKPRLVWKCLDIRTASRIGAITPLLPPVTIRRASSGRFDPAPAGFQRALRRGSGRKRAGSGRQRRIPPVGRPGRAVAPRSPSGADPRPPFAGSSSTAPGYRDAADC